MSKIWKVKTKKCPNCGSLNTDLEEDLLACNECQGLWRGGQHGLVQISQPQEKGYAHCKGGVG